MSGNSVYKKEKKSRKRKNNDEDKENIEQLNKRYAEIVGIEIAMAKECINCGKKFTTMPSFDNHRFALDYYRTAEDYTYFRFRCHYPLITYLRIGIDKLEQL